MAEEFKSMPTYLQHTSSMLVHNKKHRTVFICSVISLMALTSVIGVVTCPITVRPYPEVMVLEQQQQQQQQTTTPGVPLPVQEKLTATTTGSGVDHFILTFLEAALSDEPSEAQKTAAAKENNTVEGDSSNIELKLTRVVNEKAPGRSRREFFRFLRSVRMQFFKSILKYSKTNGIDRKNKKFYLYSIELRVSLNVGHLLHSSEKKRLLRHIINFTFSVSRAQDVENPSSLIP